MSIGRSANTSMEGDSMLLWVYEEIDKLSDNIEVSIN
jgi:hypothetical protein